MNIVIADENQLVRLGLRVIVRTNFPHSKVIETNDNYELKTILSKENISLILIDYTAPNLSINSVKYITKTYHQTKCIAITFLESKETIINAIESGIVSYVKKDCKPKEIIEAIQDTLNGNNFFCSSITKVIEHNSINIKAIRFNANELEKPSISDRERLVIQYISNGLSNEMIAKKMFLSVHTVKTHRKNIMKKIGVNNTAGIIMFAIREGLSNPNKYLFSQG